MSRSRDSPRAPAHDPGRDTPGRADTPEPADAPQPAARPPHRSAAARSARVRSGGEHVPRRPSGRRPRPVPNSRRRSATEPPCAPSPGARTGPPRPSRSTSTSAAWRPTTTPKEPVVGPNRPARSRTARDVGQRVADHPARGVPAAHGVDDRPARPTAPPATRVLEGAGVGVGGARQHEQRRRRTAARCRRPAAASRARGRAHRHRVDRERVLGPQVVGVGVHRRADVAALGVEQHQRTGGPRPRHGLLEARRARASRAARRRPAAA